MGIVRFCLMFVAVLVLASCSGKAVSEGEWATLHGEVVTGPTCPHHINADQCETQPVGSALLIVLDSEGQEVARVRSNENGQFSVQVQPGHYNLVPMPVPGLIGTPEQLEVAVDQMSSAPVTIKYDTGIRSITPPDQGEFLKDPSHQ